MKSFPRLILLLVPVFVALGCSKEDDCLASDQSITEYITANGIMATEGDLGLYYIIEAEGGAEKPTTSSSVTVNYTGQTTNGETFDQTSGSPRTFLLSGLIQGWQQGIPKIGRGGKIRLFIPSSLAYGANQAGDICPSSDLIFDIELVDFN
ncbi:FKBP-type peptidyl-prolyl cis-trans isomerase [Lewinella aquimaris]|uniref:Peptidyl-prolyl cis-trans isomerase n=1 Tax=Neolewinella aquimaris TaxID=1835722 RepID=A0A840E4K6_9BACT|nr:FKBP-type peptidyl-prolyl cis-trans isomerase [Neolewinella aquimaris]MBB4078595.1 FKBP-type peptidyl-prolyl cis-trans isomerase [Neolewinella aquimaris]